MARAGFYAIQNSEIRFGRDGRWYADGQPIANQRIADLFSSHIERDPGGGYRLRLGPEQAPVIVDDTPYVVVAATPGADGVAIELNDHTTERLDPDSLRIGSGHVLYCDVKAGREPARFLRPAYYQLAPCIEENAEGGFALRVGGIAHPIRRV